MILFDNNGLITTTCVIVNFHIWVKQLSHALQVHSVDYGNSQLLLGCCLMDHHPLAHLEELQYYAVQHKLWPHCRLFEVSFWYWNGHGIVVSTAQRNAPQSLLAPCGLCCNFLSQLLMGRDMVSSGRGCMRTDHLERGGLSPGKCTMMMCERLGYYGCYQASWQQYL